ncbi:MAG TPA: LacI family DNA-binding transcriptional regulator [Chthoniobacterales bacterium]
MATLRDVAELAGVSVGTASMALNQGEVKESTRKRVLDCAKRLSYVPNRIGRTLNTGKSNTIALLMMTSVKYTDTVHKTSPFYCLQQRCFPYVMMPGICSPRGSGRTVGTTRFR